MTWVHFRDAVSLVPGGLFLLKPQAFEVQLPGLDLERQALDFNRVQRLLPAAGRAGQHLPFARIHIHNPDAVIADDIFVHLVAMPGTARL